MVNDRSQLRRVHCGRRGRGDDSGDAPSFFGPVVDSAKVPAGSMLAVSLSPDKLQPLLFGSLDISVENAPELSVVSGSKEDLKKRWEVLQGFENINTREIPIEIPAHSQLLAPVLDEFFSVCKGINFQQPTRRFISSHTNEWADDKVVTADWRDHFKTSEVLDRSKKII